MIARQIWYRWKNNSAAQEERFSRKKHDSRRDRKSFNAVKYVLKESNLKLNEKIILFF